MTEPVRQVLNPIWNSWYFLSLYGGTDDIVGRLRTDQQGLLDRYILAKTAALVEEVTAAFDAYDLAGAAGAVTGYLDALTNWYVRRSRDRFWRPLSGDRGARRRQARRLRHPAHRARGALPACVAPLLPFLAEEVCRGPDRRAQRPPHRLARTPTSSRPTRCSSRRWTSSARSASAAHSVRKARGLPARLPLPCLTVAAPRLAARSSRSAGCIAEEVNVKRVELVGGRRRPRHDRRSSVVPAALGPRLGPATQQVIDAVRRGEWQRTRRRLGRGRRRGPPRPGEYRLRLRPLDEADGPASSPATPASSSSTSRSRPSSKREGTARDVVRIVQQARKDADLQITDRIEVVVEAPGDIVSAVGEHEERFREQTLTTSLWLVGAGDAAGPPVFAAEFEHDYTLPDGRVVTVRLRRWREEPAAGRD